MKTLKDKLIYLPIILYTILQTIDLYHKDMYFFAVAFGILLGVFIGFAIINPKLFEEEKKENKTP